MNPFDFILRAWRNQPLTPAERGVYRALKTLLLAAISAGVIAGVEYGHSRAVGQPFQTGSLVNAVLMAAGVSLAHGVAQWAQTHGDAPLADTLLSVAVSASAPQATTRMPSVTVPSLPTPSVTVPSLPTPSVTVPSLPTPSVTVPSLPTPSVLATPTPTVAPAEDTAAQPTIPSLATVTGARTGPATASSPVVSRASHPTLAAMVQPSAPASASASGDGRNAEKDAS